MTREAWDPTPERQRPRSGFGAIALIVSALAVWTTASYLGSALAFVRQATTVVTVLVLAIAVVNLLTKRT